MGLKRAFILACRTMSRNRLRAFFMMLGVVVGIASLTALSSVGESTRRETVQRFARMVGTIDTVTLRPGGGKIVGMPTVTDAPATLKFDDSAAVARLPGIRRVVDMQIAFDVPVKYRASSDMPTIFGTTPEWVNMRNIQIAEGDSITDDDVRSLARVVVIGLDVRQALFNGEDPVGKTVRLGDVPFQVKGVLGTRGSGPGGTSLDNFVLIPVSTSSRRLFNRDSLTMVVAQLRDANDADAQIGQIRSLLRERHHLVPPALDDFSLTNPRAALARANEAGSTLSKVLSGVAALATLIGGVVIMSLMLIAVSERRQEIGVRRSVGASRQDVLTQFLLEAATISAAGGVVGVAAGLGASAIATSVQKLPPILEWGPVAVAVAVSVVVGLVFGVHPAWKASRVDPIAALRS